jgi:hypothetical protein
VGKSAVIIGDDMTPKEQIFQSAGLFSPGVPKPNGTAVTSDPLQRLTRDQLIRMAQALQVENRNLRDGIQVVAAANEELRAANQSLWYTVHGGAEL